MKKDEAIAARMERVAEIEAQIDPTLRRRGRVVADLVTIAVLVLLAFVLDLHVTHPIALLSLMASALGLNHFVPRVTERRLRRERQRLLAEVGVSESGAIDGSI
jgi:hypothetical protein